VPEWQDLARAELETYQEELELVYAPCALGCLLEAVVPLSGKGWSDPGMPAFMQFVELASAAYRLLPANDNETTADDCGELECFLGATVSNALSHSPFEIAAIAPYLGPGTLQTFEFSITLPSVRDLWRNADIAALNAGSRYEALPTDPASILPAVASGTSTSDVDASPAG
jgi:hypothetical protein